MTRETQRDPLVALAIEAVEEFIRSGRKIAAPAPVPAELSQRAGAFVCLKRFGRLRGCIGTIEATEPNLACEIVNNAISAATRDPRFSPVRLDELDSLEYSVDVLSAAEPIKNTDELDPKVYGVIVESGHKRGLLLPDLDGVDTIEEQIGIAAQKAGISSDEPVSILKFTVTRHA